MFGKRLIAAGGVGLLLLAGCDDRSKSSSTSSAHPGDSTPGSVAPAANPKSPASASNQSAGPGPTTHSSEPPHSSFMIADARTHQALGFNFPRARLRIDRDDKTAVLYSDDPKNAIDDKSGGNGYSLIIQLTDDALAHLDGYQWHFRAASSEQQDSTDGIFLKGQRYQLQPWDVTVTFSGDWPMVTVVLEGTFHEFDMNESTREGTLMEVKGTVSATVDVLK